MRDIPKPALFLGLSGVLPFAFCALTLLVGLSAPGALSWPVVMALYGAIILSFMSGCIWAFAARQEDRLGYALSTLPALLGFFALLTMMALPGGSARSVLILLFSCFVLLLLLDRRAADLGQTPTWWMALRGLLTSLVCPCLLIGAFA